MHTIITYHDSSSHSKVITHVVLIFLITKTNSEILTIGLPIKKKSLSFILFLILMRDKFATIHQRINTM